MKFDFEDMTLAAILCKDYGFAPHHAAYAVQELGKASRKIQRANADECNTGARAERKTEKALKFFRSNMGECGIHWDTQGPPLVIHGDPRGAGLSIKLKGGQSNSLGGDWAC